MLGQGITVTPMPIDRLWRHRSGQNPLLGFGQEGNGGGEVIMLKPTTSYVVLNGGLTLGSIVISAAISYFVFCQALKRCR
jgi:hypothetical protein